MATLTARSQLSLIELAKRTHNQNLLEIAENLTETNEMFDNAVWTEANGETSHKYVERTSLPNGSWRAINEGVDAEASSTIQRTEELSILETYSEVDKLLVDLAPNGQAFRSSEDMAFVEGLGQTLQETLIYGNKDTSVREINGLATRYNALSYDNVFSGTGSTSNVQSSIWIVQWGMNGTHLVYPRGHKAMGINVRDLGEETKVASDGKMHQVYRTHFQASVGLVVKDPRSVARIANIETSVTLGSVDYADYMIQALNYMRNRGQGGNTVIYCNRDTFNHFDVLAKDKTNVQYTSGEVFGKPVTMFRGIPVRMVEQITTTEAVVA